MSSPADVYEQEADRVADQVMTDQPDPHRAPVQTQHIDALPSARAGSTPPLVRDLLRSGGRPLDPATRGLIRSRMGEDFGTVRIHTGHEASRLAHRINARAFTVGHHIGFAAGQYAPETLRGQKLLAHELTHVLQQGAGRQATARSLVPAALRRKVDDQRVANQPDSLPDLRASGRRGATTVGAMGSLAAVLPAATMPVGDPRSRAGDTSSSTSRAIGATTEETAAAAIGATRIRPKTSSGRKGPPSKPAVRPGAASPIHEAATRPTKTPRRRTAPRHGKAAARNGTPGTIDGNTDFQAAAAQVRIDATRQKAHPLPSRKRTEVEKAAVMEESEQNDQSSKERNTKKMAEVGAKQATAGKQFSAAEFKADLKTRVEAKPPRSEDEARHLAKSDAVAHFEDDFSSKLASEQGKVTDPLTEQAKDPSAAGFDPPVNAVPIPKPGQSPSPTRVNPALVVPKPQPDRDAALQRENDRLGGAMQNNRLDDDQLAESREPSFIKTLTAKRDAEHQIVEARAAYRRQESNILHGATAQAGHTLSSELAGMSRTHARTGGLVHGGQKTTETQTQKRQREIKKTIDGIYTDTVDAVTAILGSMATKVKEDFANSLKTQTDDFNRSVRSRLDSYYSTGKKIKHFFLGEPKIVVSPDGSSTRDLTLDDYEPGFPPRIKSTVKWINPEVYDIFLEEKKRFLTAMDQQLDVIAANVQVGLTAATNRIALGRFFVSFFKASLKGEERTFAEQLEQDVLMKFQTLEGTIDDAREDLLQTLADQYRDSVNQLETTFNDINDELKKSWLDKAVEFIETVGKTVFQLADLLFSILTRVAHLVWDIVKHPIRFFETLVSGLMQGVGEFISHIGTYLQEAFWTWITDVGPGKSVRLSLGSGLAGLFDLVVQVLSLGPADLRAIVDKVLGPEFMQMVDKGTALAEKALEPVMILVRKGPVAFWHYLEETLGSIIQSSFDRIKESVFFAFVEKGLKWIAGFFIPGGGFVKIVKAIVKAFQFVAANLDKIRMFFDAVFDSMEAATEGRTEGVASKIVNGLKMGVVLALDFLARQLGLDTIIGSVHKIIHALRRPIVSAIEWVLRKVKPFVTKIVATGQRLSDRARGKKEEKADGSGVKASVRTALAGRNVNNAEEEKALIEAVYNRFHPEGLKGIRFEPSRHTPGVLDVIASASLAETIARLNMREPEGLAQLRRIASHMSVYASRTTIYVFYDADHKRFGTPITQKKGQAGHAERYLEAKFPDLLQRIVRERKRLVVPFGDPVPIHLDINRTPCDGCSQSRIESIVNQAKSREPDLTIKLTISAVSISQGAQITSAAGLARLLAKGVELTRSEVWNEIEKQLKKNGIEQLDYNSRRRSFTIDDIRAFIEEADEVNELIDNAVKMVVRTTPAVVVKGSDVPTTK